LELLSLDHSDAVVDAIPGMGDDQVSWCQSYLDHGVTEITLAERDHLEPGASAIDLVNHPSVPLSE
jgi:hypothetical protein